ncbi:MAG: DNA-directed RNA polymerase subunit beta', partial [Patescibacteria group bacterium]
TRRLVDVAQDTMIREADCKSKEGIEIFREDGEDFGYSFGSRLFSRAAWEDIKIGNKVITKANEVITKMAALEIEKSKFTSLKVRSPIYCKTLYGICGTCYGLNLADNRPVEEGLAVGVIAAQSIGEPGTQLTMRTFHVGGIAGLDITHGLPRIEELFEARAPKGKAILAMADGVVDSIETKGNLKILTIREIGGRPARTSKSGKVTAKKDKIIEYKLPAHTMVYVKAGDTTERGQQLSEGHLDLRELLTLKGAHEVIRYITREVHKIYLAEGASIHNKHIEVIIRQMFSRVKISKSGDAADLILGEIIERSRFLEVNRELKKQGGEMAQAEQLLLGITRVALSTESFLSAASFQDTPRALVKAAVEGRIDSLRGLKENVIIGRLIPTGSVVSEEPVSEEGIAVATSTAETVEEEA